MSFRQTQLTAICSPGIHRVRREAGRSSFTGCNPMHILVSKDPVDLLRGRLNLLTTSRLLDDKSKLREPIQPPTINLALTGKSKGMVLTECHEHDVIGKRMDRNRLILHMLPRAQPPATAKAADADVVTSLVRDDCGVQPGHHDLTDVDRSEPGCEGGCGGIVGWSQNDWFWVITVVTCAGSEDRVSILAPGKEFGSYGACV